MEFLKNPSNPHNEIFSEGLVSHCSQISVWIMDPLCPPNPLGSCWKKIYLILEQFSNEFLRGRGFESRLRQFGFSTYLLWAITNVHFVFSILSPRGKKIVLILEQFSIEFLHGRGFESHLQQFGFSTYLLSNYEQ